MQDYNYHLHTTFSDGRREPEAFVEHAIKIGLNTIGFSDHSPIPAYPTPWNMELGDIDRYFDEINELKIKYQKKIRILLSMEVDFIDGLVHPNSKEIRATELDYTIGSVHFLKTEEGTLWDYEGSSIKIKNDVERYFHNDIRSIIGQYYGNIRKMVRNNTPDIIGHLDRIKVMKDAGVYFDEYSDWYVEEINNTLEEIAATCAVMEINTKGIYGTGHEDPYPSYWILQRAKELGIPVHLSSDAHNPEDLDGAFFEVHERITSLGFEKVLDKRLIQCYK